MFCDVVEFVGEEYVVVDCVDFVSDFVNGGEIVFDLEYCYVVFG